MSAESYQPAKLFTIRQANSTLPLVRAITNDIVALSREIVERRERLNHLSTRRQNESRDLYSEELSQIEEELQKDTRRLREYAEELRQLGVELKSAPDGLVDFPSMIEGRIAYLCWKHGEPEVLFWHELDAGFAGRQPLTAASGCQDSGHGDSGTYGN
jgi:hypothetical protein